MTKRNEMIEAINNRLDHPIDWLTGGFKENDIIDTAQEWVDNGFSAADAPAWWAAGSFDAARAFELRAADLTPDECAVVPDDRTETIAYAHSNGDICAAEAVALAKHDDPNHVVTTDPAKLYTALIGDDYDWTAYAHVSAEEEADTIIHWHTLDIRITVSDASRTALIALVEAERADRS